MAPLFSSDLLTGRVALITAGVTLVVDGGLWLRSARILGI